MNKMTLVLILIAFFLSGCLTNKETYYTYYGDDYDGQITVYQDDKEEVSFAGVVVAVGAAAALVLGAMAETATK